MTAHKHAEIGIAKLRDMALVVFSKHQATGEWGKVNDQKCTDFSEEMEYFLCHPKHAEVCLHWLNGGDIEYSHDGYGFGLLGGSLEFREDHLLMLDNVHFRIKPRKEKRWIVYQKGDLATTLLKQKPKNPPEGAQLIEIEVEV